MATIESVHRWSSSEKFPVWVWNAECVIAPVDEETVETLGEIVAERARRVSEFLEIQQAIMNHTEDPRIYSSILSKIRDALLNNMPSELSLGVTIDFTNYTGVGSEFWISYMKDFVVPRLINNKVLQIQTRTFKRDMDYGGHAVLQVVVMFPPIPMI